MDKIGSLEGDVAWAVCPVETIETRTRPTGQAASACEAFYVHMSPGPFVTDDCYRAEEINKEEEI